MLDQQAAGVISHIYTFSKSLKFPATSVIRNMQFIKILVIPVYRRDVISDICSLSKSFEFPATSVISHICSLSISFKFPASGVISHKCSLSISFKFPATGVTSHVCSLSNSRLLAQSVTYAVYQNPSNSLPESQ